MRAYAPHGVMILQAYNTRPGAVTVWPRRTLIKTMISVPPLGDNKNQEKDTPLAGYWT